MKLNYFMTYFVWILFSRGQKLNRLKLHMCHSLLVQLQLLRIRLMLSFVTGVGWNSALSALKENNVSFSVDMFTLAWQDVIRPGSIVLVVSRSFFMM